MNYLCKDEGAPVTNDIYIGSISTALDDEWLAREGIGAIINLSGFAYSTTLPSYDIYMDDRDVGSDEDLYMRKFMAGVKAIRIARGQKKKILVHCAAGINRSATQIGFFLLETGWTYYDIIIALSQANAKRQAPLLTNQSFRLLLQNWASRTEKKS